MKFGDKATFVVDPTIIVEVLSPSTEKYDRGAKFRHDQRIASFTEYVLPEPYGIDRETWIDNSTTPVTVWYVDHNGYMVRVQPLE